VQTSLKKCGRCQQEKPEVEGFGVSKGAIRNYCKECRAQQERQRADLKRLAIMGSGEVSLTPTTPEPQPLPQEEGPQAPPSTERLPDPEIVEPETLPVPSRLVGVPALIVNDSEDEREWTAAEAQRCVETVRYGIKRIGADLLAFYRHRGWKAMGYSTMESCLNPLFGIKSKQHFHHIIAAEQTKQTLITSKVLTSGEAEKLNDAQLKVLGRERKSC